MCRLRPLSRKQRALGGRLASVPIPATGGLREAVTVRGMELPFKGIPEAEDAAQYMRECHADEGSVRPADEPAVLVRASAPGSRDVYHGDVECGLLSGEGRRLEDASWMLLGNAKAVGYGPCMRCGSLASAT